MISIVTPVHNSELFLSDCIESVLSQTYTNWELLLVDDCSSDGSSEIAQSYTEKDHRISLIRLRQNAGAAVARNTAIEAATGEYLAFLDSDDLWLPNKLDLQLRFMQDNRIGFSHTWYGVMDEAGNRSGKILRPPPKLSYRDMLKSNQVGCLTAMYNAAELGKVYMPLIRKRQDYGLWLAILKKGESVFCLPQCTALYRQRTGSISSNKIEMLKYNWRLYRRIEKLSFFWASYYLSWNIIRKVMK